MTTNIDTEKRRDSADSQPRFVRPDFREQARELVAPQVDFIEDVLIQATIGVLKGVYNKCHTPAESLELLWTEYPNSQIKGVFKARPDTTVFLIIKSENDERRGSLYGAFIPDEDEGRHPYADRLISDLMHVAAPSIAKEMADFFRSNSPF